MIKCVICTFEELFFCFWHEGRIDNQQQTLILDQNFRISRSVEFIVSYIIV